MELEEVGIREEPNQVASEMQDSLLPIQGHSQNSHLVLLIFLFEVIDCRVRGHTIAAVEPSRANRLAMALPAWNRVLV